MCRDLLRNTEHFSCLTSDQTALISINCVLKTLYTERKKFLKRVTIVTPFDVSSVFAKGCKECVHGLVNSLSTVGLLFPWVNGTMVYCPVQILRGSASIFTTQGRKYSARNVQDISCIPCRPRHLLGTC